MKPFVILACSLALMASGCNSSSLSWNEVNSSKGKDCSITAENAKLAYVVKYLESRLEKTIQLGAGVDPDQGVTLTQTSKSWAEILDAVADRQNLKSTTEGKTITLEKK